MRKRQRQHGAAHLACSFAVLSALSLWWFPFGNVRADVGLGDIVARVRSADIEGALKLLGELPAEQAGHVELRYLAARLHEKRGRWPEALAALPTELGTLPPEIALDVRRRRALWLAKTAKCDEAKPLFGELLDSAQHGAEVSLTLAAMQCALDTREPEAVLSLWQKLGSTAQQAVPARLLRARALQAKGERKVAIEVLREICLDSPEHSRSDDAQRLLEKLVPKLHWSDEERLRRAQSLLDALRPLDAIAELDRMHAPKAKAVRARALHLRGMALFQMRTRYAEAAKVLDLAAKQGGVDAASDAYHAARALARADRDADAVAAYRAFIKRYPDSKFVGDAAFAAAWLELRHDMPGGEAHMRTHLGNIDKGEDREAQQVALWELAYYLFDHGQYEKALPLFERYAASTNDAAMVRGRGLYWAGRAALLAGKRDVAVSRFQDALRVEPLHWYHLLARQRLTQLGQSVGDPFDAAVVQAPVAAEPAAASADAPPVPEVGALSPPAVVEFYLRLGLQEDALDALREREDELRKAATYGDALIALVATYHALDEHARPYRLVERERLGVMSLRPDAHNRSYWDALFPRPYGQDVASAGAREQLPEDFVYSIMRKESAYDPRVVSSADAMGLLQLIEPTARTMAKQVGVTGFSRTQLFTPAINIRLGAHYLANLRTLYKGQYVPAIAAYNAGEHRVNSWLARAKKRNPERIELDRFVEEIPIEQTRNYVRRVVANWARYRYLQDPASVASLELPELLVP